MYYNSFDGEHIERVVVKKGGVIVNDLSFAPGECEVEFHMSHPDH